MIVTTIHDRHVTKKWSWVWSRDHSWTRVNMYQECIKTKTEASRRVYHGLPRINRIHQYRMTKQMLTIYKYNQNPFEAHLNPLFKLFRSTVLTFRFIGKNSRNQGEHWIFNARKFILSGCIKKLKKTFFKILKGSLELFLSPLERLIQMKNTKFCNFIKNDSLCENFHEKYLRIFF